jgi:hypothetical protein
MRAENGAPDRALRQYSFHGADAITDENDCYLRWVKNRPHSVIYREYRSCRARDCHRPGRIYENKRFAFAPDADSSLEHPIVAREDGNDSSSRSRGAAV